MGQVGRDHTGLSSPISLLKQANPRAYGTQLCPDGSSLEFLYSTVIVGIQ